jgi:hypothetical protein
MGAKPRAEEASRVLHVRMSPAEILRLVAAANVSNRKVSEFARDAIVSFSYETLEGLSESTIRRNSR